LPSEELLRSGLGLRAEGLRSGRLCAEGLRSGLRLRAEELLPASLPQGSDLPSEVL
jgi:hypothetical protein